MKDRGKPRYKNSTNLPSSSTKHSLYNNLTPLEFNQATPNAYQMIALCLCPLRAYFLEFPLISVNSRKLFGSHGYELRVVSPGEGDIFTLNVSGLKEN